MGDNEGFDKVFHYVGSFGSFQVLLLLCITLQALVSLNHLSAVFLASVPPHWCKIPELELNSQWSLEQIRNISIPKSAEGSIYGWEACQFYNLNYTKLLQSSNNSFEVAFNSIQDAELDISKCSSWNFDSSIYKSTLVTQFELVCERRVLVGTIQGTYMAGVLIGSLILGSLSDQLLGRRKSVLISLAVSFLGGFASAFATSYETFLLFRFILAAGVAGSYQNSYVLMLEYTNKKSRAGFGLIGQVSFAFGYMLVAMLGYFFRDWSDFQLATSIVGCILLSYYWILPESARWLVYRGEDEKALKLLELVARLNRMKPPDRAVILEIFNNCRINCKPTSKSDTSEIVENKSEKVGLVNRTLTVMGVTCTNYLRLLQTPEMRKRTLLIWMLFVIVDLVYYGVVFDSATLTKDPFLLVFLAGLMEVPAYTLVIPCLTTLGRRPTVVWTFMLTAICSFAVAYASVEYVKFRVVVSMCGKLFITTCFAVLYLLGAELFPTATRTTGLASAVIMGRLGSILAPFIVDMMKTMYQDLPNIIFGLVSVAAAFLAFLLPETRDSGMFDDINGMEKAAQSQPKLLDVFRKNSTTSTKLNADLNQLNSHPDHN